MLHFLGAVIVAAFLAVVSGAFLGLCASVIVTVMRALGVL